MPDRCGCAGAIDDVLPDVCAIKDGLLNSGDAPGHGVDIDEDLAARFPYQRAYLPVARLTDGTLWNW
jgi:mannonate dehydratase